jgi:FkbM family methyltransferase
MTKAALLQTFFRLTLGRNSVAYRLCRKYVDYCRGESQYDMCLNGEARLVRQALPGAEVVFDIGAHVGSWTRMALDVNPHAQYHCFEPSSSTFRMLQAAGLPANVRLNHCALGAGQGSADLYVHEWDQNTSLHRFAGDYLRGQVGREAVRVDTVDAYCERNAIARVDFMKVDVEGYETAVLRGAADLLQSQRVRCVQFEHAWCAAYSRTFLRDYFDLLPPLGYFLYKLFPEGPLKLEGYSHHLEATRSANYLAALPGVLADCGVRTPLLI